MSAYRLVWFDGVVVCYAHAETLDDALDMARAMRLRRYQVVDLSLMMCVATDDGITALQAAIEKKDG